MTAKGEQKVQDSVNQDDLDTNQNDDQVDNQDVQDETQNTGDENVQDNVDTGDENVESVEDFLVRVFDAEANGGELSEEDVAKAYGLLWDEVVAAKTEGELQIDDELLEGEKITDEKRGSLPRSSFAGPGKYFPVNDCAHIVGVRRLLNKVELSDEVKEKLVKVVDRKAKARNCGTVKKDATTKVQDNQVSRVMHSLLNAIEEDSYYSEEGKVLDEESITMLRNLLKKLSGMVGKDSLIKALTVESLVSDDTALLNEVERLEDELGEVRDRLEAVQKEYNLVYQDMDSLQDALVDEKTKTRKALEGQLSTLANLRDQKVEERDWTNLDDSAITSEVARLTEEVDMNKIADKLGDGMSRIPSGDVDSPEGAIQDDATNQVVITDDHMRQIEANYFNLLFSKGQIVADAYRAEMMRRGYFPTQGTESAGGTN